MYISICKSASEEQQKHKYYNKIAVKSWTDIANLITSRVWSAIIWQNGERAGANFLSCEFAVLDIDDGLNLAEALKFLDKSGFGHVVATTKSHQVDKGDGVLRDRFRVVLKWERPITDPEIYRYNIELLVDYWGGDKATTNLAHKYMKSLNVVSVKSGKHLPVEAIPKHVIKRRLRNEKIKLAKAKLRPANGEYPEWVNRFIRCGQLDSSGGRKRTIYSVACALVKCGMGEYEAISTIQCAPISWEGIPGHVVKNAVKSAARKFKGVYV